MKKEWIIEGIILFFLIIAGITGFFVFRYQKIEKPNTYTIIFKDIDSIVKGSPVRFMGINIGHVVKLKRKDKYILCQIRVTKKGVKIPNGTKAKVAFNGLAGSKSIELFPPSVDNSSIKGIEGGESLRIDDLVKVIRDLRDVCIIINNFVQDIDPDTILDDFNAMTNPEGLQRTNSDIQRIIDTRNKATDSIQKMIKYEGAIIRKIDKIQSYFRT